MIGAGILLRLCKFVNYSFGNDSAIRDLLKPLPITITSLEWLNVLVVECLVIHAKEGDIYVFKSSDSKEDWDDNYKFFPTRLHKDEPSCCFGLCDSQMVHTGFNKQFNIILPELLKIKTSTTRALFTGFSLGGALATITANSLKYKTKELITFGSPKVGNHAFVKSVESQLVRNERWVLKNDYVTRLPPGRYYQHTGRLNVVGYSTLLHKEVGDILFFCKTQNYEDHDLYKYIPEVDRWS